MDGVFIPLKISSVFQGQKVVNPDNVFRASRAATRAKEAAGLRLQLDYFL